MAIIYPSIATGDFASTKTANNFSGSQTITGSLFISGSISSSNGTLATLSQVTGAITASTYWVSSSNFLAPTSGINITGHTDTTNPNGTDRTPSGGGITFEYDGAAYKRFPGISYVYGGTNYGTITAATFGSTTTYGGLNIVLSADSHAIGFANSLGASGINDGVRYAEFIGNGNLTTSGQAGLKMIGNKVDQDVLWFSVNGQRLHLGVGTNDYLYSDGTRVRTPGDLYASQTVSGSTGLFTTITASVISASQYVGLNGYATLLSNNFSGSQAISGNLNVTGSQINLTSSELKSFSKDGIYFSLKTTGSTNDAGYRGAQINAYQYTDYCEIDLVSRTTSSDGGIWLEVGPSPSPAHSASLWLQNNGVVELYGQNTDIISQTIRISGSNTTVSGNLNITGSSSLIKNSDITLSGKDIILTGSGAQDDWIQLALNTDTYGRIDVYNSGINTQSIDIYAGPTGAVYLGAGDQIPSGLNGSLYAGGTWQKNWVFVESNNGLDYIDLQTVTNGGTINIGTLSKLGESGSINIGTSGSVAGVKAITIGNTLNNSSTTISGNLNITGSNTIIISNTTITGSITNSGSLSIFGSGSAAPLFHIQGSQGQLFSVIDSLTGSLFSVNDISGLPILEVFSDNTILQGSFSSPSLNTTVRNILSTTGSFVVYAIPTASYDAGFFDYVARSGSNARAGQIMTLWSGSSVNFTETSTTDFGNTSDLTFGSYISGSSMVLTGSATTSGWTIKTIVRSI